MLQLFYTVYVSNILPRKVAYCQLTQYHIPQGFYHELQILPFPSLTLLTTILCDRNMLTVEPIIDFLCFEARCLATSMN
jgi:hypothetical protein